MLRLVISFLFGVLLTLIYAQDTNHIDEEYELELVDQEYVRLYSHLTERTYTIKAEEIVETLEYDNM